MPLDIYEKLDFFSIFDEVFDNESLFRVDEHVEAKIKCVKFDQLDKQILCILLNESSKRIDRSEVICRIQSSVLMNRVGLSEDGLYYRIRKLLSLGLNVYTQLAEAEYSLCVIKTLSEKGKRVAYEVSFDHLSVLKRVFNEAFIDLLTGGVDKGPSGAYKLVVLEKELFFLSYLEAFNYGKIELKARRIDYQIYQMSTNELVYIVEHINSSQETT